MARALISKSSDRVRKKRTRSRSRDAKCAGEWGLSLVRHPRERCEPWPALCLVSSYIFADRTRERSKSSRGRTSPSCDCAWRGTGNISIKARARSSAELEAPLSPLPAHCCCRCRRRTHHEAEQLALARIEAPNDESAAVGRDLHLHEEEQWLVEVEWLIEMHTVVQACHHLDAAAQTQRFGYCPEQIDARGKRWGNQCASAHCTSFFLLDTSANVRPPAHSLAYASAAFCSLSPPLIGRLHRIQYACSCPSLGAPFASYMSGKASLHVARADNV